MGIVEDTKARYFAVSVDLLNANDLNMTEAVILSRLYGLYIHGDGVIYCSDEWISNETGANKKTVARSLRSLEGKHYIMRQTTMGKGNGRNRKITIEQKFYDVTNLRDKESYHPDYEGERFERLERQAEKEEKQNADWYTDLINS